jgi:hypothetical protein
MKKLLVALTLVLAAAALSACSSESTSSSPPSSAYRPTTTTISKASLVDAYVDAMRDYFPRASRSELIDLGQTACDTIDEAGSLAGAVVDILSDPSWAGMEEAAGYTFGVSIPVFCPEYTAELNRLIR